MKSCRLVTFLRRGGEKLKKEPPKGFKLLYSSGCKVVGGCMRGFLSAFCAHSHSQLHLTDENDYKKYIGFESWHILLDFQSN